MFELWFPKIMIRRLYLVKRRLGSVEGLLRYYNGRSVMNFGTKIIHDLDICVVSYFLILLETLCS